ncbi:MAG: nucleoside phosphorylase [Clostridiales bacterium]|nr:nucleoside phosphorylase [Clostridiales bacterium]
MSEKADVHGAIFAGEKQFHLKVTKEQVGGYVIMPGDPGRVPQIARHLDSPFEIAYNREFCTYGGYLEGELVNVVSSGIGGPSAAIAVEELILCGAHTFIRVGTSGGMVEKVVGGDLVIATAAVRSEGASAEYLPEGYPAAADFRVTSALEKSARALSGQAEGSRFHVGVVHSKDSFYGETHPQTMPVARALLDKWQAYLDCGCLASEMECAALFSVTQVRKARAGAVLTALWNVERSKSGLPNPVCRDNERAIRCAVAAIRELIASDKAEI